MNTEYSSRHVPDRPGSEDGGSSRPAAARAARIWAAGTILVLAPLLGGAGALAAQSHVIAVAGHARSHQHARAARSAAGVREISTPRRPWLY